MSRQGKRQRSFFVALRNADDDGLSGTEIRDLFGRHASINEINRALAQLEDDGFG